MNDKKSKPYIEFLNANYNFKIIESFPDSVKASNVVKVVYSSDTVEIIFKQNGKTTLAVLGINEGTKAIMKMKREIIQRKNYEKRFEDWECRSKKYDEVNKDYFDIFDFDLQERLIESRATEEEKEAQENFSLSVTTETLNSNFNLEVVF